MSRIATDEDVREWSRGELRGGALFDDDGRPAVHGLECERVFGPVLDYVCRCERYRGERHRGLVCERCAVEIIPADARAQRLGHIRLACPIPHPRSDAATISFLPVLAPGLRPSTPESTHPISVAYQRVIAAREPTEIRSEIDQLFEIVRVAALERVQSQLADAVRKGRLPAGSASDPTPTVLWHRAVLLHEPAPARERWPP
jgi:hypothetical protein